MINRPLCAAGDGGAEEAGGCLRPPHQEHPLPGAAGGVQEGVTPHFGHQGGAYLL